MIMAYDEALAARVREKFAELENTDEKEMMGGLVFMYNEKMCAGVIKDELMCRIDPDLHEIVVEKNGCRTMDFTKRPMKGYILVDETGLLSEKDLSYWVNLALEFNKRAKSSKKTKKK
jgi:TfoX/Sxy family transcriptional regulator of competence genes